MGKGAGEKNRFHKFLDESYFAFWFRQWAAGFMILGVILIIVGAVVSQVIPPEKYKEFAQAQLVTSPDDENYNNWASKIEKVRYDFMNVNPGTLAKTLKGPYVYSRIVTKTHVTFTATTVKYTLSVSKTFSTTESEDPSDEISLLNPSYAQLISATSPEQELLFNDFQAESPNLGGKLKNFFNNDASKYIGAIGLAKSFAPTYKLVRENGIFPNLFSPSGLGKAVSNYARIFEATYLPFIPCQNCVGTPVPTGIKASLNNAYNTNSNCRFGHGQSQAEFDAFFAGGFAEANNTNACGTFFLAHKLTTVWTAALAHTILFSLDGVGIRDWYDLQDPSTKGYCGDKNAAATFFSASVDQITEICDDFIPKFFPELKTYVFKSPATFTLDTSLGLRRLCSSSTLGSSALNSGVGALPNLAVPGLPAGVTLSLEDSLLSSFSNTTCTTYLSALTDTDGFANAVYDDSSFDYNPLSSSQVKDLYNYIHDRDTSIKQWFSSYWIGTDSSLYEDACAPNCHFHSFGFHATPSLFNATTDVATSILYLLFPEESPTSGSSNNAGLRTQYSITNTAPRVFGNNLNLFSNASALDSSGIIAWLFPNPSTSSIIRGPPVFDLTAGQFDALAAMLSVAANYFVTTDYGFISGSDAGLTQFARAQLACGPLPPLSLTSSSPRCYMESTFFGLTGRPYYYEYAYASYTIPTPAYHFSFTSDDSTQRDVATTTSMQSILNSIQSSAPSIFADATFHEGPADYSQRYFWYLMSTYVKAASIPSTSGIFAKRTAFQWLSGFDDAAVDAWGSGSGVSTNYAIDPDGDQVTLTVQTGASDILTAYLYSAVNGAGTVSVYTPAESVVNSLNFDGLPPTKVSPGSSVTFFSPYLMRNLKVTFASKTTDEASNITSTKGEFSDDDWATGSHNITQKNMLPVPGVRGAYISTCNIDLPSSVETFTSDPKDTDDFPTDPAIYADLGTGLVVRVDSCYLFSASTLDSTFPITGAGLGSENKLFTQVMRRSVRQISATQSDAYLAQYRQVNDTSLAILLALVIVGGLFFLTGIVFLVFWLMRRNRKLSNKAEMDLVADPFGEKKSNVGNMKY